ncbi:G-patch domain protein [Aspergillus sclerotialis]|uniref:G-patch domain protein n=1 Tax=Aspergillus sclerotialis TaxID=2070753 RepID=A0A3A2ZQJ0_9EURO|nr:G-patch domain protein [Aspergillus sclerotialis]
MPPPDDDEEEDYMSMVIEEPVQKETFTQKKLRKQREAEARSKVPSKSERAAQEAARRDEGLSTSALDPSSKGYQMMAKLGFKPGDALGKRTAPSESATGEEGKTGAEGGSKARTEPLNLVFKEDRSGIGLDSERKRKIREEAEEALKKVKREEGDYRDRVREERESRRLEGMILGAQKVAERLDLEAEGEGEGGDVGSGDEVPERKKEGDKHGEGAGDSRSSSTSTPTDPQTQPPRQKPKVKPTPQINILYRGLVRSREDRDKSILARHALHTSLPSSFFPNPRLPSYDDETLEREDKEALGTKRVDPSTLLEQELEEEDPELEEFNALEPAERLRRLVMYLRDTYRYCFWCKFRYEDEAMEGCPGTTEEDHD